jgi:hypothetical protein
MLIEQAKGVLAEQGGLDMDQAFTALRRHARGHNRPLRDVASAVIAGTLDHRALAAHPPASPASLRPERAGSPRA